jgi:hypothetical protein
MISVPWFPKFAVLFSSYQDIKPEAIAATQSFENHDDDSQKVHSVADSHGFRLPFHWDRS